MGPGDTMFTIDYIVVVPSSPPLQQSLAKTSPGPATEIESRMERTVLHHSCAAAVVCNTKTETQKIQLKYSRRLCLLQ